MSNHDENSVVLPARKPEINAKLLKFRVSVMVGVGKIEVRLSEIRALGGGFPGIEKYQILNSGTEIDHFSKIMECRLKFRSPESRSSELMISYLPTLELPFRLVYN